MQVIENHSLTIHAVFKANTMSTDDLLIWDQGISNQCIGIVATKCFGIGLKSTWLQK